MPCPDDDEVFHRQFQHFDEAVPEEGIGIGMLYSTAVLVTASRVRLLGGEHTTFEYDGSEDWPAGVESWSQCLNWIELEVTEVLFEDYRRIDGMTRDGRPFPPLPEPPFVVTVVDTNWRQLLSVASEFADVPGRVDEFVFGLSRGPSIELVGEPGVNRTFSLTLVATADASEVFLPDAEFARRASERFSTVRDRLGVDGIAEIVRQFHAVDDGGAMWLEMFPDLYPPVEPVIAPVPSWHELDPSERRLGYDPTYDGGVPDEELANFEAIGLDFRIEYVGFDDVADWAGVVAVVSDACRSHNFGLTLAVQSHMALTLRLRGEELRLMLSESAMVDGDGEIEIGRITGVRPGHVAVIDITATPDGRVDIISITERPPTDSELAYAANHGIQPNGTIDPTTRTITVEG